LWTTTFDSVWPIDPEMLHYILETQNHTNPGACDVVVAHQQLIGLVAYQQNRHAPPEGSIVLVLVDPEYRRKKIGKALVKTAVLNLRKKGVRRVVLGAWADPQFWHGVPENCPEGKEFFRALGWQYYEQNADLVVNLPDFVWPASLKPRLADYGTSFRAATDHDHDQLLEFVHNEYQGFTSYYVDEIKRNGPSQIRLAITEGRIDAAIIKAYFPHCPGSQWHRLLGNDMCAMGGLLVRRDMRRRGLGLGLCSYTLDEMKRDGSRNSYLEWATIIHMYQQLGGEVWQTYSQARIDL
jgi:GNAT superfamily N-acetyltransferase